MKYLLYLSVSIKTWCVGQQNDPFKAHDKGALGLNEGVSLGGVASLELAG
jgi:hypothetical protein